MNLLDLSIGASLVLAAALGAAAACRNRSAALRHLILSIAIAAAVVLPLAQPIVPEWTIPVSRIWARPTAVDSSSLSTFAVVPEPAGTSAPLRLSAWSAAESLRRLLLATWLAGAGLGLLRLLAGLSRVTWIAVRATDTTQATWIESAAEIAVEYGVSRPVRLLQSDHPALLVTWGLMRPKIVLPHGAERWDSDRIRLVLRHELAHVRRCDWMTQMTAELLRALHWFNPLAWIACRHVRQESEQACDDRVLGSGVEGSTYAAHLVDLALAAVRNRTVTSPALAIARPSSLERRIRTMLTSNVSRRPVGRWTGLLIAVVGFGLAAPVAGFTTSLGRAAARAGNRPAVTPSITVVRQSVLDRRPPGGNGARLDPSVGVVAGTTLAQNAFASFSGTVVDPQGGLLPGVKLALVNTQSQAKQEVRSDRTGKFQFVGILPGDYEFTTELPGFETLRRALSFGAGTDAVADLTLQIGSIMETIKVTDSDSGAVGSLGPARSNGARPGRTCDSAPVPGGIGGSIKPPVRIADARPTYPISAREAKIQGSVVLQGRIDTSGFVTDLRVARSPNADLSSAAIQAVGAWRFDATLLNCVPIDTKITVNVNFSLGG